MIPMAMTLFSQSDLFDPDAPPREKRGLEAFAPEEHFLKASDGVHLRLTRYEGGTKGPVILSHCIGVSSLMYSIDTLQPNLLEYLYANGFDIWLLDHRLSIDLPASTNQSTLDDVATKDYPAAIARVRELTGSDSVQVAAHGVGSSTLTMAMLAGLEGVRAAVCSQVSTHLLTSPINKIKAGLRIPALLAASGAETTTAYVDSHSALKDNAYDEILKLYPYEFEERCNSPVCHRITAIYGTLYEHDQLGATHGVLHELFGVVNLTALRHLSLLTSVGHLVNADGEESYLPHIKRLAIPIAFISGGENECVLPTSTEITYDLLREENGEHLYSRHVIPNYGHVDCMFGKNAVNDVYPFILNHLEAAGA